MATLTAKVLADFTTSLAGAMAIGATTATLQSATDDDGVALPTGTYYFTIDGSNSSKEHIRCTLTGTSLTAIYSVSRQGVATSGCVRAHRLGATVSLTDFAHILVINNLINGTTNLDSDNPLEYDGTVTPTTPNQLAPKSYVDAVALGTVTVTTIILPGNGGEVISAGQLLYLNVADGEWYKCDADTAATVDNIILGIAQGAGTDGGAIAGGVMLQGLDTHQTGLTNNTAYYASNTAGAISTTPGTVEVSVGVARSTTSLLFYPRYNQQLTEDQQDALVGTSGTPSSSNKYVTDADTTGTGAIQRASALATYSLAKQTFVAGAAITAGQALHISPYSQSDGGITLDNQVATAYSNVTNQSQSFTVASNSNRALLVSVIASSAPSGVTYNSVSMTLVNSQAFPSTYTLYVYQLVAPSTGTNNITVTGSGIYGISGASYYNVDQTTPVNASSKANASAGSITLNITTISQADFVHSFYGIAGLSGITSITTNIDTKYQKTASATVVKADNGSNPMLSSSTIGKANEIQTIPVSSSQSGGSGFPIDAIINIALKAATAVSVGVVPTNSSLITALPGALNEPLIDFIGFADSTVAVGASVVVTVDGSATNLSSLTPGRKYYLQNSSGAIGTSVGAYGKEIGKALSTTSILIASQKTISSQLSKTSAYQYTAECDGLLQAGNISATATIAAGQTINITGTGTNGSNFMMPVSRGQTYTLTGGSNLFFTPLT